MTPWTDLDRFIIQRWHDVVEFRNAVDATEERLAEELTIAAERVAEWLKPKEFKLSVDEPYAEFAAYRPSWVHEGQDAVVWLCVGGLYPKGYRKVDGEPYLAVYTRDLKALGLSGAAREQFSEDLRRRWGSLLDGWKNDPDDRAYPVFEYLVVAPEEHALMVMDAERLCGFAIAQFDRLLPLADGIDECLKTIKR
jgi:hypothetical protein